MMFDDTTSRAAFDAAAPSRTFRSWLVGTRYPRRDPATPDETRPPRLLVGKGPACELRLRILSSRGGCVDRFGRMLRLTDLELTKLPTFANCVRVVEALLRGGEVVTLDHEGSRGGRIRGCACSRWLRPFRAPARVSPEMRRLHGIFQRLAARTSRYIIEGETGTGKDCWPSRFTRRAPAPGAPSSSSTARPSRRLSSSRSSLVTSAAPSPAQLAPVRRLRGSRRRHAVHRRDWRSARGASAEAPSRDRARRDPPRRRHGLGPRSRARRGRTRRDLDRAIQEGRFRDDLFFVWPLGESRFAASSATRRYPVPRPLLLVRARRHPGCRRRSRLASRSTRGRVTCASSIRDRAANRRR